MFVNIIFSIVVKGVNQFTLSQTEWAFYATASHIVILVWLKMCFPTEKWRHIVECREEEGLLLLLWSCTPIKVAGCQTRNG